MKNAKNSNFLSSNRCFPNSWTTTMATKGTSFPTLVYRTSSPLEGRPHSRILQFFRTLVLFFVLLVGFEEWCYIPAGSLPHIRRVISCILFSLEQSRVVDLTVAERFVQHVFGLVIHSSSCTRSMHSTIRRTNLLRPTTPVPTHQPIFQ